VRYLDYPEKELVDKSKKGDINAFEKLLLSYEKKIFNIAYRISGNREDAYDIAQEVCIKIFKNINSFMGNSSFGTWVYRITSNVCIDEMRKKKKTKSLTIFSNFNDEFEVPVQDKGKLPDEIIENKEMAELIKDCISQLPPEHKMIIILRDINGYSYEEISTILAINLGTVKSRLSRARNLLKDKLKKKEPFIRQSV
jgi:RNA polymerase sigma-70 factor, ECF subfamily